MSASRGQGPPPFLLLAGEPLRWRLLGELARSDRQVRELTALTGQPQPLVSYHLGRLRAGGLVTARRSSADGRDAYYSLDLARCGELLAAAGAALQPGLALQPGSALPPGHLLAPVAESQVSESPVTGFLVTGPRASGPARVLFACTGNSARSQMAQAITEQLSEGTVTAASAGSRPKPLHPHAVTVMREHGLDISGREPRHLDTLAGQRFGYVISLCDKVREVCPEFPGAPEVIHWSIPDPAAGDGGLPAFRALAADLRVRIGFLLARIKADAQARDVAQTRDQAQ